MTSPAPATPRQLGLATLAALGVAGVVLLVAILPAEYGLDPTGAGALLGFDRLSEDATPPPATGPDAPVAVHRQEARWTLYEHDLGTREGYLASATAQETLRIPMNLTNLTSLTARLEWTDDVAASGPDEFEISIRAPDGRATNLVNGTNPPGGRGELSATLLWKRAPLPTSEDGRLVFDDSPPDRSGIAEWTVVIRLYRTGGTPAAPDAGNPWRLHLTAQTYALDVLVAEAPRERITLTIPAGRGVEYKLAMEKGAEMDYRWSASGPVYFDFHADLAASPDDFTSFEQAVGTERAGHHVAPFAGRHGWYWENRGSAPVTVTLETSGDYEVLGVV